MVHLLAKNTLVIFPNNKISIISVREWYSGGNKKKKKLKKRYTHRTASRAPPSRVEKITTIIFPVRQKTMKKKKS